MNTAKGENLIFILSQPRAGSTLLQRILGSHPNMLATSETWLMLHPVYALRRTGYTAEYNAAGAYTFTQEFLATLPDGEQSYLEGIRQWGNHLYKQALTHNNKQFFVEKTPRYYLILPELFQIYPNAHYIFLFRNPLAVLYSIYTTWMRQNLLALAHLQIDIQQAPHLLLAGLSTLPERSAVIYYESLVQEPEPTLQNLCNWLQIDFAPQMVHYGASDTPHWRFGDQNIYQYTQPMPHHTDKWVNGLKDSQFWRLAQEYLYYLGSDIINQMGYNFDELEQQIKANAPTKLQRWFAISLNWLFKKQENERTKWERLQLKGKRWLLTRFDTAS